MEFKTFVHRDDGKVFNFYVSTNPEVPGVLQVGGLVLGGILHLFDHPNEKPRSADRFDTANYIRLKAKAKSKFGVAKVVTHPINFTIVKDGKEITVNGADPTGQRTVAQVEDYIFDAVLK